MAGASGEDGPLIIQIASLIASGVAPCRSAVDFAFRRQEQPAPVRPCPVCRACRACCHSRQHGTHTLVVRALEDVRAECRGFHQLDNAVVGVVQGFPQSGAAPRVYLRGVVPHAVVAPILKRRRQTVTGNKKDVLCGQLRVAVTEIRIDRCHFHLYGGVHALGEASRAVADCRVVVRAADFELDRGRTLILAFIRRVRGVHFRGERRVAVIRHAAGHGVACEVLIAAVQGDGEVVPDMDFGKVSRRNRCVQRCRVFKLLRQIVAAVPFDQGRTIGRPQIVGDAVNFHLIQIWSVRHSVELLS